MRVFLASLGCKLNQGEVESLAREVTSAGHSIVVDPSEADWAIVNTCAVTHVAGRKSRQLIRQLVKANPTLRIAVTGCYATTSAQELRPMQGVHLVVGNAQKEGLVGLLRDSAGPERGEATPPVAGTVQPHRLGRTRALVKIQDGCDNRCAYCIIPVARGPQRSREPGQIVAEIQARREEGYQEVVLTGVNIGAYGHDGASGANLPEAAPRSLAQLVALILERTDMPRLRLSSVEPWDLGPEFAALWADPRLCRHLHLPLQSGCDETLRRMERKYVVEHYARLVTHLRHRVPDIAITTDIIVGFPGETEAEFEATLATVESMLFSRLHVFRYSPRRNTLAFDMPNQVAAPVAQRRSETLIALGRRMAQRYHARFVGREVVVLAESARQERGQTLWSGLTDNYLRLVVPASEDLANRFVRVRCISANGEGLRGELVR